MYKIIVLICYFLRRNEELILLSFNRKVFFDVRINLIVI